MSPAVGGHHVVVVPVAATHRTAACASHHSFDLSCSILDFDDPSTLDKEAGYGGVADDASP